MKKVLPLIFFLPILLLIGCDDDQIMGKPLPNRDPRLSKEVAANAVREEVNAIGSEHKQPSNVFGNADSDEDVDVRELHYEDAASITSSAMSYSPKVIAASMPMNPQTKTTSTQPKRNHKISIASIEFRTSCPKKHADSIRTFVQEHGGYLEKDTEQKNYGTIHQYMTIRVPVQNYLELYDNISNLDAEFVKKNSEVIDVAAKFRNLEERITSELAVEREYRKLLNKAAKMADIIMLTEKLNDVRSYIESMQSDKNKLEERVAWSTIVLEFQEVMKEKETVALEPSFFDELGSALAKGWDGVGSFVIAMARAWPLVLFVGLLFFPIRRWYRSTVSASAKKHEAVPEQQDSL